MDCPLSLYSFFLFFHSFHYDEWMVDVSEIVLWLGEEQLINTQECGLFRGRCV